MDIRCLVNLFPNDFEFCHLACKLSPHFPLVRIDRFIKQIPSSIGGDFHEIQLHFFDWKAENLKSPPLSSPRSTPFKDFYQQFISFPLQTFCDKTHTGLTHLKSNASFFHCTKPARTLTRNVLFFCHKWIDCYYYYF